MSEINVNRHSYNIFHSLPTIRDFPVFENHDESSAVLMRLFRPINFRSDAYQEQCEVLVNSALWNMRAHILNSDIQEHRPRILFHIEESLYRITYQLFHNAGVPEESVLIYPDNLFPNRKKAVYRGYLAAAPLVDAQLDRYERVIVLDVDSLSLSSPTSGVSPLMDISMNRMSIGHIGLLRGWTVYPTAEHGVYDHWMAQGGRLTRDEWINKIARLCGTEPNAVQRVLYPEDYDTTLRPEHNGAYIHIPMHLLRGNSQLRTFIRDTSISMGHEEIALAIWFIKIFIETSERLPWPSLCEFNGLNHTNDIHNAWTLAEQGTVPSFLHIHSLNHLDLIAYDFAKRIGASDSEADQFAHTITTDYDKLRADHRLFDIHGYRLQQ